MKKRNKKNIELFDGLVYNSTFLQYNTENKIVAISNEKIIGDNVLEINNELIKDFHSTKKSFFNFSIEYFINLKNGIIQKEENLVNLTSMLHVLPIVDHFKNEVTLLHNKKFWELKFRDDVKYENFNLTFFISKKDDPSFFYSYLFFNSSNFKLDFKNEIEFDLKNFSIFTMKKFNSYGVKEII